MKSHCAITQTEMPERTPCHAAFSALIAYGCRGALPVRHRHLDDDVGYQPAAIDDIISRGLWKDWQDLRQATIDDPSLLDWIERICQAYAHDPYAQRHYFWMNHVRHRRGTA